jgi:hypothetical protein
MKFTISGVPFGADEIAFILAVLGIHDDDDPPAMARPPLQCWKTIVR